MGQKWSRANFSTTSPSIENLEHKWQHNLHTKLRWFCDTYAACLLEDDWATKELNVATIHCGTILT